MLSLFMSESVYPGISSSKERTNLYEDILTLAGRSCGPLSSYVQLHALKSPKVYPLCTSYILHSLEHGFFSFLFYNQLYSSFFFFFLCFNDRYMGTACADIIQKG